MCNSLVEFYYYDKRKDKTINLQKNECIHVGHRERMRSKILNNHVEVLLDHELLEVLLYYSLPRRNTNDIAHNLIKSFGTLANVFNAKPEQLMLVPNVSEKTTALIKVFAEMFKRYNELLRVPKMRVSSTGSLRFYFEQFMTDAPDEELYIAYIDDSMNVFACDRITIGSSSRVETKMREIYENVLRKNPSRIALSHNHPYTTCAPSREDISSTVKIKIFLKLLNVELMDHIIFGNDGYCSINSAVEDIYNMWFDTYTDVVRRSKFKFDIQRHRIIDNAKNI